MLSGDCVGVCVEVGRGPFAGDKSVLRRAGPLCAAGERLVIGFPVSILNCSISLLTVVLNSFETLLNCSISLLTVVVNSLEALRSEYTALPSWRARSAILLGPRKIIATTRISNSSVGPMPNNSIIHLFEQPL